MPNPILPGFNPDPSICRGDDGYYICCSSFTWFPGLPIYFSKDLVNWELVGHGLTDVKYISFDGMDDTKGIWAPTLRQHDGKWYIFYCKAEATGYRMYYITASDPRGEWSAPKEVKGATGIDPSVFWDDDGRSYLLSNGREAGRKYYSRQLSIWMQEINLETGTLTGDKRYLSTGHAINAKHAEAPHLYKIDGRYVLLIAEGGTDFLHSTTVFQSNKLMGPYIPQDVNPVLSNRQLGHSASIQCVGHSDLVQTDDGRWFAVALGKRMIDGKYTFTRETFICPVSIENGQLFFNPGHGCMTDEVEHPGLPHFMARKMPAKEEFDGSSIGLGWYTNRVNDKSFMRLKDGKLLVSLCPEVVDSMVSPAMLMRRTTSTDFVATTSLTLKSKKHNENAGMILMRNHNSYVTFLKSGSKLQVVVRDNGKKIVTSEAPYAKEKVILRMEAKGLNATVGYLAENSRFVKVADISLRGLSDSKINRFNGLGIGMYATSNGKKSKAKAAFDFFEYTIKDVSK